jgi:hypothetical protein
MKPRHFIAYFWFVRWSCISFGITVDVVTPNIEIHVPFGFFKIGWESQPIAYAPTKRALGFD